MAWDEATGEITRLHTHPRGQGRGAAGARRFYERHGWREEGPARVRDWHGTRLREPRYVRDL